MFTFNMVDFFESKQMEANELSVRMTNFPTFFGSFSMTTVKVGSKNFKFQHG